MTGPYVPVDYDHYRAERDGHVHSLHLLGPRRRIRTHTPLDMLVLAALVVASWTVVAVIAIGLFRIVSAILRHLGNTP